MKKKNFKMDKFDESKKAREVKRDDLITQYKRMTYIACDIYDSDFFAMATKKEQKEIEASIARISKTLISMIGMEAINNSHDCLPDDSGNGNDHSWDNLPDDSGEYTDTDKASHDAIKKMKNIVYGETKSDSVKKATARQILNSVYGAPHSIMAMNRKILSELGIKSPADKPKEDPSAFGNEYDDDSDGDEVKKFEVNLGNFIDGPFYSDWYRHICQLNGFNIDETLKRIVKAASDYTISKLNLVGVVGDKHDIKSDDKYYPNTGDVFFVTNRENDKDPVFVLIYTKSYLELFDFDIDNVSVEIKPVELEESTKTNDIEFINSDAYFNIGKVHLNPNTVIDLDATLEKIKDEAKTYGIDTITFVDTIDYMIDISTEDKYTLKPGDVFFNNGNGWNNFMLIVKDKDASDRIRFLFIESVGELKKNTNLDDIKFIGYDAYYSIDNTNPNYTIDLSATLIRIGEKAKEKGIKTIVFEDSIDKGHEIFDESKYSLDVGSLFYIKNCSNLANFVLVTEAGDTPSDTRIQVIESVTKSVEDNSDSDEDSSNSEEDDIEAVETEDKETAAIDPYKSLGCKSSIIDRCLSNQYANVDTSEMSCDDYAKAPFPIFMKPTMSGKDVNFVDICNIYNFDVSETIKRIKNVAYLAEVGAISYVGTIDSNYEIFRETADGGYLYDNGSLFLMTNCTNAEKSPYFVILRKVWDDYVSQHIFTPYRVNPIMKSAKINNVEEIDVIDDYADGTVRIGEKLDNIISIYFDHKIREICEERNYDYDTMISCIMGIMAIIGVGSESTFEGTVDSINSIISVDPMVAYNMCSIFFVNDKKEPYFVIYMPITGKTKSGHNFRLYRIYPIPKQDPNTNSKDDSNVREINQFTSIYLANSEVNGPDKDVYMKKVEFYNIDYLYGKNQSLANICNDWKFNGYDTIKRIKLVAYRNNLEEIKFAGTVCSHEEISEKEVLYDYGSVLFVSDAEDPHFVIIEYIGGVTWMNRINPVDE